MNEKPIQMIEIDGVINRLVSEKSGKDVKLLEN
jgi:hypothetical protein